ncbi:MAG: TIGR01777 family protein [Desulfobulbaceae bacterium]|nr:TIGR01777 family protein [Desulfobulbaceae bacterium]
MKILITGGTGFVGSAMSKALLEDGHEVTIIGSSEKSCSRYTGQANLQCIAADTTKPGPWQDSVAQQDALINLAGRSVFTLWTKSAKEAILDTRIKTTRNLVDAIPQGSNMVLLSTSAAGYYGNGGESEQTEASPSGNGFLARVCREWEAEARRAEDKGARVAIMRFAVVMGEQGGALKTMKLPFQLGLGGPIGSGRQWFPWIHLKDLVAAAQFLLNCSECRGPFNFTAPDAVRQIKFAKTLAAQLGRPAFFPAPAPLMKLGLGEFGESLLQGQKVLPRALEENGFVFTYPKLEQALRDLL